MSRSNVAICNNALTRLGAGTISAMDEGSKESIACDQFFEDSRDATLRDFKWNFATRRKTLALTTSTVAGWSYCYAYPSDCLAARAIYNPGSPLSSDAIKFEVALGDDGARVILTNQDAAVLIYTARVTDLSVCDPLFIEAFTWKLTAEIALPITQDRALMQIAESKYQSIISKARAADANESEPEVEDAAPWIKARMGYPGKTWDIDRT